MQDLYKIAKSEKPSIINNLQSAKKINMTNIYTNTVNTV